jgi:hypothetical protein
MCSCDKSKSVFRWAIISIGIILICLGIFLAVFAWQFLGGKNKIITNYIDLNIEGSMPVFTLTVSIICILTGLFAILSGSYMNPCFTIPFSCCSLAIGGLMIVIAVLAAGNNTA